MTINDFLAILPEARQWLIDQGASTERTWPHTCALRYREKTLCPITMVAAYISKGEYIIANHRFEFAATLIDLKPEDALLIAESADGPRFPYQTALSESLKVICEEVVP